MALYCEHTPHAVSGGGMEPSWDAGWNMIRLKWSPINGKLIQTIAEQTELMGRKKGLQIKMKTSKNLFDVCDSIMIFEASNLQMHSDLKVTANKNSIHGRH